jgi:hypothetical protein
MSPPRPEALFHSAWARAIVIEALATTRLSRELDLPRVVDALARCTAVDLPRLTVPTLARGCQLLIDFGAGLAPFTQDREELVETIRTIVGRDRLAIFSFEECPLHGVGTEDEPGPVPYTPPGRGTSVAVITDLGIARIGFGIGPHYWLTFATRLRAAGCPLVAFVPSPWRRWPAPLAGAFAIVEWDRSCTATAVRRARDREE